ncbi:MAG TPA: DUF3352 domain-containing protein [Leptolyngbyaceae cyanobacterium]
MPEKKPRSLTPWLIGAAVIATGGIVAYFYLNGNFGDATSPLASAKIVPSDALMAGTISTDPQAWAQLQKFGTPEAQTAVNQGLNEFNKQVFTDSKINYEKDIKPWLGNVMFAVIPSNSAEGGQKSSVLAVVGIKNKISAWNFANKFKSGTQTKETDYKGIKVIETGDTKKDYLAVLNNHLVWSSERKPVELAIDTFKGQRSFASKQDAATILSKGVDMQNTIAQIYIPEYGNSIQKLLANNPSTTALPQQSLDQLKQVKSLVMGLGIDNDGLRMKAIGKVDPSLIQVEYKPSPGKVVSQFPLETIALISGHGISTGWSVFVNQAKNDAQIQQQLEQTKQQLKTTYNLDLDKDVFSWMNGEFALGAIASNQGLLEPIGVGGALVLKTSDRATAEATFAKLDEIAKTNQISISQRDIQGKTITEWKLPNEQTWLGHGWLDRESVFVAVGQPIIDVMATNSSGLNSGESFKAITSSLQQPNVGYFYIDVEKLMMLVNRHLPEPQKTAIPPETTAILNSIRGIGITANQPDRSTSNVEMLLALKRKV